MLKLLLSRSIFISALVGGLSLPGLVSAHPLDQTFTTLYIVTDDKRQQLPANTAKLVMRISWQQLSYIHEKGEDGVKDPEPVYQSNAFDRHMSKIYASPKKHRDYIMENLEIKAEGEDCDITSLTELPYNKEEVLLGKGVEIVGEVVCPGDPSKGTVILNRMFFEDFPYQTHEVELYMYGRLIDKETVSINDQSLIYPDPTPAPNATAEPVKKNISQSNWVTILLIVGMVGILALIYVLKKRKISTGQ